MDLGDRAEQIATLIIPGHGAPFEPDSNTSPLTGPE
jgi:hypothetical protein